MNGRREGRIGLGFVAATLAALLTPGQANAFLFFPVDCWASITVNGVDSWIPSEICADNTGTPVVWNIDTVRVHLGFDELGKTVVPCEPRELGETWNESARASMQQWNEAGAAISLDGLEGSDGGVCTTADHLDGKVNAAFANSSCVRGSWGITDDLIAATFLVARETDDEVLVLYDADVAFSNSVCWSTYAGERRVGVQDFRRVFLHELGIVLGLSWLSSGDAVMNIDAYRETLADDDKEGILALYPGGSAGGSSGGGSLSTASGSNLPGHWTSESWEEHPRWGGGGGAADPWLAAALAALGGVRLARRRGGRPREASDERRERP